MSTDGPLNKERLEAWYRKLRKPLRQWISRQRLIRTSDIDDVAHEVFLRLLRYSDGQVVENPVAYVRMIARNVCFEWGERSRMKRPHSQQWLEDLLDETDASMALQDSELTQQVQTNLNKLKPRQRDFLMLHVNGMTYKQIAQARGTTYRIVLRELTRGYSTLRASMKLEELV